MNVDEIISNYLISRRLLFASVVISRIGYQYFFEHYQEIAESDIFGEFAYIDDIAKLTFDNRYILDIPWDTPEHLTDDEKEYGSIDPRVNKIAECVWAERGRKEIKAIASDFKHYCLEELKTMLPKG